MWQIGRYRGKEGGCGVKEKYLIKIFEIRIFGETSREVLWVELPLGDGDVTVDQSMGCRTLIRG